MISLFIAHREAAFATRDFATALLLQRQLSDGGVLTDPRLIEVCDGMEVLVP